MLRGQGLPGSAEVVENKTGAPNPGMALAPVLLLGREWCTYHSVVMRGVIPLSKGQKRSP